MLDRQKLLVFPHRKAGHMSESKIMFTRVGGFAVLTGTHPETGEDFVLLLQRGVKYEEVKTNKLGCFGGHLDIENGEQPFDGVIREVGEELIDDEGNPVIIGLDPTQLRFVANGVDYTTAYKKASLQAGTFWTGYTYRLSAEQVQQVWRHIKRLHSDMAYKARVVEQSDGEMEDVIMEPVNTLRGTDPETLTYYFAYPHEARTVIDVVNAMA